MSVTYDIGRLIAGLGLAAVLLGVAVWLVHATDWRPPTEADAPELDRAMLDDR